SSGLSVRVSARFQMGLVWTSRKPACPSALSGFAVRRPTNPKSKNADVPYQKPACCQSEAAPAGAASPESCALSLRARFSEVLEVRESVSTILPVIRGSLWRENQD